MTKLDIIGAIDGGRHYRTEDIIDLLATQQLSLGIGESFTGRPCTRIYANQQHVVKIRAELDLSAAKAHLWAESVLKQERLLAVHHPYKTWFICYTAEDNRVLAGNICPRLNPLHIAIKPAPKTRRQRQKYLALIAAMFEKYFFLAKRFNYKLDEGFSNFAVDPHGAVYYLDDEYYAWDNFVSFAVMLGVFIRGYDWLDRAFIKALARQLGRLLDEAFDDPHCRVIVLLQLESVFMPTAQKEQLLKKMLSGLSMPPDSARVHPANKKNLNARKNNKNRYFAVMADIHANHTALECVLAFYRERNITQGIVLGDIVGYGPEPQRCIELLQSSSFEIIKGNHDHAVATGNTGRGFSANGKIVIDWTIEQLAAEHKDWLNSLPVFSQNRHWLAVHGAPIDPAFFYGYVYQLTAEENLDHLQQKNIPLCLHGHSHMPGIYARDARYHDHHLTETSISIKPYTHVLICPGSVGQPRNGTATAQCAVYDSENHAIEFINLSYSLDSVIEKMQRHGLPEALWQRLLVGR